MCWRIEKTFKFEAAHHLEGLPATHQCARVHGHSYRVTVTIESNTLQDQGWVWDFGELAPLKKLIDERFDHRDLNEVLAEFVPGNPTPTSENLAWFFFHWCKESLQLPRNASVILFKVSETEGTSATYYR